MKKVIALIAFAAAAYCGLCAAEESQAAKRPAKIGGENVEAFVFDGKTRDASARFDFPAPASGAAGVNLRIRAAATEKTRGGEFVFRAKIFQIDPASGEETNALVCPPVRAKLSDKPEWVELESCYFHKAGMKVAATVERKTDDEADNTEYSAAVVGAEISPVKKPPEPMSVQKSPAYNSWPMIQALGNRLVCVYSRGKRHTIADGGRGSFARYSDDFGKTWSEEIAVANDPDYGEVPIGKGLDENGNMLVWIRCLSKVKGKASFHQLFRSENGAEFKPVSRPSLSPRPMQITDVFRVPNAGLMSLWFATNYDKKAAKHSWGTLVSKDNGATWTQTTVEKNLDLSELPTEQAAAYIGGGKIFAVARTEFTGDTTDCAQFQLESSDFGKSWTRKRTNIGDVKISTPTLVYDEKTGVISNYYYQRGRGILKRRAAKADAIWGNPTSWGAPEIVAFASADNHNAGNANATAIGGRHFIAYYSGNSKITEVLVSEISAPAGEKEKARPPKK